MRDSRYVCVKETAALLGCTRKHVYRMMKRGQLERLPNPIYRPRGPVRILRAQVEALRATLHPLDPDAPAPLPEELAEVA